MRVGVGLTLAKIYIAAPALERPKLRGSGMEILAARDTEESL